MMDSIIQAFRRSFASERLLYQMIDESNVEHTDFLHYSGWGDPVMTGLGTTAMLKPATRKESLDRVRGMVRTSIVAVMITLRRDPEAVTSSTLLSDRFGGRGSTLIGHLCLAKSYPDETFTCRAATIGINISLTYQGTDYGREALNWAIDYGFRFAGLHRIDISTVAFNQTALALYRSVGFVQEGCRRKTALFDMDWHDEIQFGMLEDDYLALRRQQQNREAPPATFDRGWETLNAGGHA